MGVGSAALLTPAAKALKIYQVSSETIQRVFCIKGFVGQFIRSI